MSEASLNKYNNSVVSIIGAIDSFFRYCWPYPPARGGMAVVVCGVWPAQQQRPGERQRAERERAVRASFSSERERELCTEDRAQAPNRTHC